MPKFKAGDWVVVLPLRELRDTLIGGYSGSIYFAGAMEKFADGMNIYQVKEALGEEVWLVDPYNHNMWAGNYLISQYVWHQDWLKLAGEQHRLAKGGDAKAGEEKKVGGLYYSDSHPIIEQQPGESDKAYLRRILGGR